MGNEQVIRNLLLNDYPNAIKSGQAENYIALFSENVTYIPDGGPTCRSKAEMEGFLKQMMSMVKVDPIIEIEELTILNSGVEAFVAAKSQATMSPLDGSDPTTSTFRAFWLLIKEADGWKITKQIWNTHP